MHIKLFCADKGSASNVTICTYHLNAFFSRIVWPLSSIGVWTQVGTQWVLLHVRRFVSSHLSKCFQGLGRLARSSYHPGAVLTGFCQRKGWELLLSHLQLIHSFFHVNHQDVTDFWKNSHLGIPPVQSHPHFVKHPLLAIFIGKHLFGTEQHEFLKDWIPHELLYTIQWISPLQLQLLNKQLAIISNEITFCF